MAENQTVVYRRAVKLASEIMQAAGLCRYDSYDKCRHIAPTNEDCAKCIERWLVQKVRKEVMKEKER